MSVLSYIAQSMDSTSVFLLTFVTSLVIYYIYKRPRNLPPGPRGLPIAGNLWRVLTMTYAPEELASLSEVYGPVMRIQLGPRTAVMLSSCDAIQEAFVTRSHATSGRPEAQRRLNTKTTGIIMKDGDLWKSLRRFSLSTLRDFGYGRNLIQEKILEEYHYVVEELASTDDGVYYDTRHLFSSATSNVICSLVFNRRFDNDDQKFIYVRKAMDGMIRRHNFMDTTVILDRIFPVLPSQKKRKAATQQELNNIYSFIQTQVDEHKSDFDASNIRDYVDVFLKLITEGSLDDRLSEKDMFQSVIDLFVAGTETTATTLSWAVLYMMAFPEIQTRCQNEIDKVIDGSRLVRLSDKTEMPYVEATLLEIQRMSSVVPLGVPHRATQDVTIAGFHVPKDSMLLSNIYAAHHDKRKFEAPHVFRPERFLAPDGRVINADLNLSFSIGPRICLGEGLARSELFLFFANLLNCFTFSKLANSIIDLTSVPKSASIREPLPYHVMVTRRHS